MDETQTTSMNEGLKINLNATIEVELTKEGLAAYSAYKKAYKQLLRKTGIDYDLLDLPDNIWRGQLWEAINIFGPKIGMGQPVPFVDNVFTLIEN